MKYKTIKEKNYNLQLIDVPNFRSCHFALIFRDDFDPKKAVCYALLSDMITDANKDLPSSKYVLRKMEDNYILNFYGSFSNVGNKMQTYIVCDYVDPRYIKEDNYLDNVYKFIFDMLKKPLVKDNVFDEKLFNLAKRRLLTDLKSCKDDNNFLSINKALKLFAPSSPTSFHLFDMMDFIENLKCEDMYKYYEELIKEHVDIFVTGGLNNGKEEKLIKKYFPFKSAKKLDRNEVINHNYRMIPIKKVEKSKFKQSTIVTIYNVNNLSMFEREFVASYYLNVLNTANLNSKLYQYLRNENSLCYTINSYPIDRSNILIIKVTVKAGEERKALKLIKKAFSDMKNKISNEEFVRAYYAYESSLKGMVDSIGAINRLYMNMYYGGFSNYDIKKKEFKKVTIDDIYSLAKKVKLNTVYVLKGDINERNQD